MTCSDNKKLALLTYGCQMNNYDSQRIAGILSALNYSITDKLMEADLILLNTCSIREKAEQKVFSQLGRLRELKKRRPDTVIGVCGCIAQMHGERLIERAPHVDMVMGTNSIDRLTSILRQIENERKKIVDIDDDTAGFLSYTSNEIARESKVKAFVTIMEGCSNFCSYCVVPYTRGKERSRRSREILYEVKRLADAGYKEISLLGQNVNSYGKGMSDEMDFPDLLASINEIEGLKRIRFVTSHPKDMSDKLIDYISNLDKVCEHIHLPVQSGSNSVLKMMNRGYTVDEYLEKIERLKSKIPNVTFSTDIIVGFPGETENDFEQTKYIVENIKYSLIYLFKYSPRLKTRAAALSNRIPQTVISERFEILSDIQREIMLENHRAMEGNKEEILVEGKSKKYSRQFTGRTRTNKIVNFYSKRNLYGRLANILITRGSIYSLEGRLI